MDDESPMSLQPTQPLEPAKEPIQQTTTSANDLLLTPIEPASKPATEANVEVDLAKATLDASAMVQMNPIVSSDSSSVANQDISWYNQGIQLIEDGKYREALSSFDRAFAIVCQR